MSRAAPWSDEEHNLLVAAANKQIEAEKEDGAKLISWTQLWQEVTATLKERGYSRSAGACGSYWKRIIASEMATEKAAGPAWSDDEHNLLSGMTDAQLEAEEEDPKTRMSWDKWWKKVSARLKQEGYNRSPTMCEAHWVLIDADYQNINKFADRMKKIPEDEVEMDSESSEEDIPPVAVQKPVVADKKKPEVWTDHEDFQLASLRSAAIKQYQSENGDDQIPDEEWVWGMVAESLKQGKINRTAEECEERWEQHGKLQPPAEIETPSRKSTPGSVARSTRASNVSGWAVVNAPNSPSLKGVSPAGEASTTTARSLSPEVLPTTTKSHRRKDSLVVRLAANPSTAELEAEPLIVDVQSPDEVPASVTEDTKEDSIMTEVKPELASLPPVMRRGRKVNRFSPAQRAVLDTEVEQNGPSPGAARRLELAVELGVDEGIIKNWFVNFRSKRNRESLAAQSAETETGSAHEEMADAPTPSESNEPNKKRKRKSAVHEGRSSREGSTVNKESAKAQRLEDGASISRAVISAADRALPRHPLPEVPVLLSHASESNMPAPTYGVYVSPFNQHGQGPPVQLGYLVPQAASSSMPFMGNHGLKYESGHTDNPDLASIARAPVSHPAPLHAIRSPPESFYASGTFVPPTRSAAAPGSGKRTSLPPGPMESLRHNGTPRAASDASIYAARSETPKPITSGFVAINQPPKSASTPSSSSPYVPPKPSILNQPSTSSQSPPLTSTPLQTPGSAPTPAPGPMSEQDELAFYNQKISALKATISSLESTNSQHQNQVQAFTTQLNSKTSEYNSLVQNLNARMAQAQKMQDAEIARAVQEIRERHGKDIHALQEEAQHPLDVLNANIEEVGRSRAMEEDIVRRNDAEIRKIRARLVNFEGLVEAYGTEGKD